MQNDEHFYWCEPMLGHFQTNSGELMGIPVCADYCDAWFEACRNDLTCAENLVECINVDFTASCPQDSTCHTYREVYGDGRALCNKIWGNEYFYSTDIDNCTLMTFDQSMANPNFKLTFPRRLRITT